MTKNGKWLGRHIWVSLCAVPPLEFWLNDTKLKIHSPSENNEYVRGVLSLGIQCPFKLTWGRLLCRACPLEWSSDIIGDKSACQCLMAVGEWRRGNNCRTHPLKWKKQTVLVILKLPISISIIKCAIIIGPGVNGYVLQMQRISTNPSIKVLLFLLEYNQVSFQ